MVKAPGGPKANAFSTFLVPLERLKALEKHALLLRKISVMSEAILRVIDEFQGCHKDQQGILRSLKRLLVSFEVVRDVVRDI